MRIKPYLMKNKIQPYSWGTRDADAYIPRFLGMKPEPGKPYAELWMGTHPNAPSMIDVQGAWKDLGDVIAQYPEAMLGARINTAFGPKLPFLFKVLSIAEPLSIQSHPDKKQAEKLHAEDPENYPDDNHKPEIAVALDSLTALMGFRTINDLAATMRDYPELQALVGPDLVAELFAIAEGDEARQQQQIHRLYSAMIDRAESDPHVFRKVIDSMTMRLSSKKENRDKRETLFLECQGKYPYDVGLISVMLLDLVILSPGEGFFIGPGIPHAYLKGNIIECMANSDNVVRAGLTPKFKDVKRLLEILACNTRPVPIMKGDPEEETVTYSAPVSEFELSRITVSAGRNRDLSLTDGPCMILVHSGSVRILWQDGEERYTEHFEKSASVFFPAALGACRISGDEDTVLFVVRVP